jgi:hypothetical protein
MSSIELNLWTLVFFLKRLVIVNFFNLTSNWSKNLIFLQIYYWFQLIDFVKTNFGPLKSKLGFKT